MSAISSYGKVRTFGDKYLAPMAERGVFLVVQEKYDGSQVSWSWTDLGQLHVRSKGKVQYGPAMKEPTDKMFRGLVDFLLERGPLFPGAVMRAEWFISPKHNRASYDRRPSNGLVLFDVEIEGRKCDKAVLENIARVYEIDMATTSEPTQFHLITKEFLEEELGKPSSLGGQREGIVIKALDLIDHEGKTVMAKYVSPDFKEKQAVKEPSKQADDFVNLVVEALNTDARFEKTFQTLRDEDSLTGTMKDVGPIMKGVSLDILEEESDWIEEQLLGYFLPRVRRQLGRGVAEWYVEKLATEAMEKQ